MRLRTARHDLEQNPNINILSYCKRLIVILTCWYHVFPLNIQTCTVAPCLCYQWNKDRISSNKTRTQTKTQNKFLGATSWQKHCKMRYCPRNWSRLSLSSLRPHFLKYWPTFIVRLRSYFHLSNITCYFLVFCIFKIFLSMRCQIQISSAHISQDLTSANSSYRH